MDTKCLECKYFGMWDGDPVCFHPEVVKIILPDGEVDCNKYDHEEMEKKIKLHKEEWNHYAPGFFDRYFIDKILADKYLKYHPEHKELIQLKEE